MSPRTGRRLVRSAGPIVGFCPLKLAAIILAGFAAVFACAGCDDDPMKVQDDGFTARRGTPQEILTSWFEAAYSSKNATRYAEMLAPEYRFEFTHADAESLWHHCAVVLPGTTTWAVSSEVASAQLLFDSPNVGAITLDIPYDPSLDVKDSTAECPDCRKVTAIVSLRVMTNPQATDPLILVVETRHEFIVARDRADETQWVIRRQTEFESPGGKKPRAASSLSGAPVPDATEEKSWGSIKAVHCPPPAKSD